MDRILMVPDTHVPYHDKKAFELMLKVGSDFKPDILITLGDFADFYSVSSHDKDPNRVKHLEQEVVEVNKELDRLTSLGAKRKIYIAGNHENRLERYLATRAPELFNVVRISEILKLRDRNWQYVPYKADVRVGKLYLTHDVGAAGRNAIFNALNTYQHNVVIGHTHRLAYIVEGNAKAKSHVAASFGWLGDSRQADYMHRIKAARDWALGFGIGYREPSGVVHVQPVPIVDYKCVVNGKLYKV